MQALFSLPGHDPAMMLATLLAMLLSGALVGYTGFGFNLLVTPMLALLVPPKDAVFIGLLAGTIVNGAMAFAYGRRVDVRSLGFLVVASVPGLLLGTYLATLMPGNILKLVIGCLTVGCAILLGLRPPNRSATDSEGTGRGRALTVGAGSLSGLLTTTTGMGGPPIVLRLMLGAADARRIRATVAAYTAVTSLVAVTFLVATSQAGLDQVGLGATMVPVGLVGLALGVAIFRRHPAFYYRMVIGTLIFVGVNGLVLALT